MSATCVGITPSLPSRNPNANRTNERLVQLTWTDGRMTRTAGYDDNLISASHEEKENNMDIKFSECTEGPHVYS